MSLKESLKGKVKTIGLEKKSYVKPEIKTEKVELAELGSTCNGMTGGGKKAINPCTVVLS